jgi:DNA repair protein RecN (Recombination protein N)
MVPVSALARVASGLVEMHGQHQGLRLLSPAAQTDFLDRFAGSEHLGRLQAFGGLHGRLLSARKRLEELDAASRERERQLDLLEYQVREIEAAGLRSGELGELEAEGSRLAHAESLVGWATSADRALSDEGAGADALRIAAAALEEAGRVDPGAVDLARRAASLSEEAADLARELRAYREGVQVDPTRLASVRERLQALRGLERKYGEGEEGILAYLAQARAELASLGRADEQRQRLEQEVAELGERWTHLAGELSAARVEAAPRLADAVGREMRELGMEGAGVRVGLRSVDPPGPSGAERAEFLFAGGAGQVPLPLSKVASGGELSRSMLACRSALVDLDDVPTLVFDEVDVGIGGRAAAAVGRRLAHLVVSKTGGTASVAVVDGTDRIGELSRMLSGLPESQAAAVHAEELLTQADRVKRGRGRRRPARAGAASAHRTAR